MHIVRAFSLPCNCKVVASTKSGLRKTPVLLLIVLLATINARAQFSAKVYHDGGNSNEWPGKMIKTRDGNVAMCGYADSLQHFTEVETGGYYPFTYSMLVKMRPNGTTLWKKKYRHAETAPGQICAKSVAEMNDGGFVITGWARHGVSSSTTSPRWSQVFVLRTDSEGNELWRRSYTPIGGRYETGANIYESRASAADILVKSESTSNGPGNIVIAGVAEMLGGANYTQGVNDTRNDPIGRCFDVSQNGSKLVWFLELAEQSGNQGQIYPQIVQARLYTPSPSSIGRPIIKYKFEFNAANSEYQTTGVNQDQVFAALTQTDDDNNGMYDGEDGYAIVVNAGTTSYTSEADQPPYISSELDGFTVLKLDQLANVAWWRLYYGGNVDAKKFLKDYDLRGNSIINYRGSGRRNSLMICGALTDEGTRPIKNCYVQRDERTNNMMLSEIDLLEGNPLWLDDFGNSTMKLPGEQQNEEAYFLFQSPDGGADVTIFGSRYASETQESGYSTHMHQAWMMNVTPGTNIRTVNRSSSVGMALDDHFVSGVVLPESNPDGYCVMCLGHSTSPGYRPSSADRLNTDLWVARLNRDLLFSDLFCGSRHVQWCQNSTPIRFIDIVPYVCNQWYQQSIETRRERINIKEEYECGINALR